MLRKSVSFALLFVTAFANADILYNNTNVSDQTTFYTGFNRVADDFQFGPLGSTYNPPVSVSQFELGYQTLAMTSFDMVVNFYQDMDITSNTGSSSILSNLVKSYTFSFSNIAAGSNTTGLIDLASFGGGFVLPAINDFSRDNHGVEVVFYNQGTTVPNDNVSVLFKGNHDPVVGYSYDTYARDLNLDGTLTPNERAAVAGANRANFYMQITGQPVPEPASMTALALGAVAMLRRRKSA